MGVNFGQDYLRQAMAVKHVKMFEPQSQAQMQTMQAQTRQPAFSAESLTIDERAIMQLAQKNSTQNASFLPQVSLPNVSLPQNSGVQNTQDPSVMLETNEALKLFRKQPTFGSVKNYNQFMAQNSYPSVNQSFQKTGDPEADLQRYAAQKGISIEQARAELEAMYGKPQNLSAQPIGISFLA